MKEKLFLNCFTTRQFKLKQVVACFKVVIKKLRLVEWHRKLKKKGKYCNALLGRKRSLYLLFKLILKLALKQADNYNYTITDQLSVGSSWFLTCLSYILQFHNSFLVFQHFKYLLAPFWRSATASTTCNTKLHATITLVMVSWNTQILKHFIM